MQFADSRNDLINASLCQLLCKRLLPTYFKKFLRHFSTHTSDNASL